jgi:hypothetical protein
MKVTTGRRNFSAKRIRRSAFRYPSGWGIPKFLDVLLHVAALLVADDHDRLALEARPSPHDCGVVAEGAVTVQLHPVGEDPLHVVQGVGAAGVTGHLHLLDGRQVPVGLLAELLELSAELAQLAGDVDPLLLGEFQELLDLLLELHHVPLELEVRYGGQGPSRGCRMPTAPWKPRRDPVETKDKDESPI